MKKFILGYNTPQNDFLTEYRTKEETSFESEEWCEIDAETADEAKSKYEDAFNKWREDNQLKEQLLKIETK